MSTNRLAIYDADDQSCNSFGENRDAERKIAVTGGLKGLVAAWDSFMQSPGGPYAKVVFDTHGNAGEIFFNGEGLGWGGVGKVFGKYNYTHVFPRFTRVYFDGCNVAEDDEGWLFLQEVAKAFLRAGGGLVFGWTSKGYTLGIGGHTAPHKWVHLTGKVRYVVARAGGGVDDMFDSEDLYPAVMPFQYGGFGSDKYQTAKQRLDLVS